jgi:NSS family neurotransmitter:Na+ symporter
MPGGALVGSLFFVLLFFAAFTSALGMLEPFVCWTEERFPGGRVRSTAAVTLVALVLSIGPALSRNLLADFHPLAFVPPLAGLDIFGALDFVVTNVAIPTNALLIALFAGWVVRRRDVAETLGLQGAPLAFWAFSVRYLAPLAILAALWTSLRG